MGPVAEIKTIRKPESSEPQVNEFGRFFKFWDIA
jgi:hypothetical protein